MKNFKKYYIIPASASDIYLALTNAKSIMLWTGDTTQTKQLSSDKYPIIEIDPLFASQIHLQTDQIVRYILFVCFNTFPKSQYCPNFKSC